MKSASTQSLTILGVRVDLVTRAQALAAIERTIEQSKQDKTKRLAIATVNPEFIMEAQHNGDFARALSSSQLCLADGIGILWASLVISYQPKLPKGVWRLPELLLLGFIKGCLTMVSAKARRAVVPEQISGSDFSEEVAAMLAHQQGSLFLLGERPGIAERAGQALVAKYKGLVISGCFAGDGSPEGDEETVGKLNEQASDVVLVAYGAPKQELWIERNLGRIDRTAVAMGVGGTFLFLAGEVKRAPHGWRRLGMEWLYRLITQPWRWRRQLALPKFMWAVMWSKTVQ